MRWQTFSKNIFFSIILIIIVVKTLNVENVHFHHVFQKHVLVWADNEESRCVILAKHRSSTANSTVLIRDFTSGIHVAETHPTGHHGKFDVLLVREVRGVTLPPAEADVIRRHHELNSDAAARQERGVEMRHHICCADYNVGGFARLSAVHPFQEHVQQSTVGTMRIKAARGGKLVHLVEEEERLFHAANDVEQLLHLTFRLTIQLAADPAAMHLVRNLFKKWNFNFLNLIYANLERNHRISAKCLCFWRHFFLKNRILIFLQPYRLEDHWRWRVKIPQMFFRFREGRTTSVTNLSTRNFAWKFDIKICKTMKLIW